MLFFVSLVLLWVVPFAYSALDVHGCTGLQQVYLVNETVPADHVYFNISNVNSVVLKQNSLYFKVQSHTNYSLLVTTKDIDYEKVKSINLHLDCTELTGSGRPVLYGISLIVQNVVDVPIVFKATSYTTAMPENIANGSSVLTVSIKDTDTVPTWELYGSPKFTILRRSTLSALIGTRENFNYEKDPHAYNLTVKCLVSANMTLSASVNVLVHLQDVDDLPPKFTQNIYKINIPENTNQKIWNANISAVDQDKGINATVKYSIINSETSIPFQIDNSTGRIVVKSGASLDREKKGSYVLMIQAYQTDDPVTRTDVAVLEITVSDVNDNAPEMSSNVYRVTLVENTPNGSPVIQVSAKDLDEGENKKFEFVMDNTTSAFVINNTTGMITVKDSSLLDRERTSNFTFKVFAKETSTLENRMSNHSTVLITLTDENDNNPHFQKDQYTFTIKKTALIHDVVGVVQALDADQGNNGHVTYFMPKYDKETGMFNLNVANGTLTVGKSLSINYQAEYKLLIMAQDNPKDKNTTRQSSTTVFIKVEDVNMYAPIFVPSNQISVEILEDTKVGTVIARFTAQDLDQADNLMYSILNNPVTNHMFIINGSSGEVRLNAALDREKSSSINTTVHVFDGNHTTDGFLIVKVLDVNDNPPVFKNNYTFTVTEEKNNIYVGHVQAVDIDEGNNRIINYRILEPWSANFTIDNFGNITTHGRLDRDILYSNGVCKLEVEAVDEGSPALTGNCLVTVNVTDVNDNGPILLRENVTLIFDELAMPKNFFKVMARDNDPDSVIIYKIKGTQSIFTIDPSTGELSAVKNLTMAASHNGRFEISVEATNQQPYIYPNISNAIQHIRIEILDVNDHDPKFNNVQYNLILKENTPTGLIYDCINATDKDTSPKYNTVTYTIISGNDDHKFYIDSSTGHLFLLDQLDYENCTKYNLSISASDNQPYLFDGKNHHSTVSLIITVENVNDNSPVFSKVKTTTPAPLSERHDILCEADTITAFLPEDLLPVGAKLTWRNPNCTLISNSSHFLSTISHNQCGTTVNITTDSVVYKNEISLSIRSNITSDSTNIFNPMVDFGDVPAVIPVTCIYPRKQVSMLSYQPLPSVVKFYESRTGNFEIKMEMYKTNLFRDVLQDPPVRVRLQSDVNMRVSLVENSGKLDLRLEKCIATTSPLPYDSQVYTLIENSCPAQSHVKILPSPPTEARFSIKAFQFLSNRSAQVYIHCEASVCITGSSDCATNCGNQNRQKRDLSQNRHSHLISTGPLVLEADKESDLQASTVLAGVFAVVAFGAIILAVVGWRRKPTANKVDKS